MWLVLLGVLYLTGTHYRDSAIALLKSRLDDRLQTEISIKKEDISVSFLKHFPNATVRLHNVLIKSSPDLDRNHFSGTDADTLLYAGELSLIFNLWSIVTGTYELKRIGLEEARLNIRYDRAGRRNFDILRPDSTKNNDSLAIDLAEIQVRNTLITFVDAGAVVAVSGYADKARIGAQFQGSDFRISLQNDFSWSDLHIDGKQYIDHIPLKGKLHIVREGTGYHFSQGVFKSLGIDFTVLGTYTSTTKKYEFVFGGKQVPLHRIEYREFVNALDSAGLKALGGRMDLEVRMEGQAGKTTAAVRAGFLIAGGNFTGKIDIDDSYFQGRYYNEAASRKGISGLEIDTFHIASGRSTLDGRLHLFNLDKPYFSLKCTGGVEMDKLMQAEAIGRRFNLAGNLSGDMSISGRIPPDEEFSARTIQNLKISGNLTVTDGWIEPLVNALPAARVNGTFRMNHADEIILQDVRAATGKSDLLINGKIMHMPFFTGDKKIFPSYQCSVDSKNLRVEDLIVSAAPGSEDEILVQFPDSIRLFADINVDNFSFGKFTAKAVRGHVIYNPKVLTVSNFSMQSQGGSLTSEITLRQEPSRIIADVSSRVEQVDIRDMFVAFNNFRQNVIESEHIDGTLTGQAEVRAAWDLNLTPLLDVLDVRSQWVIANGELIDYPPMMGLARFINVDELRHIRFERLETAVIIRNQQVNIPQTVINSSAISLTGSGIHKFDNSYNYRMQVQLADVLWKKARKKQPESDEFGFVVDDGLGRTTLPLLVKGKDTDFEVQFDKQTAGSTLREKLREEKQTWRTLLGNDAEKEAEESGSRVEWEEEPDTQNRTQSNAQAREENETGKGKENTEEFRIEWDDE